MNEDSRDEVVVTGRGHEWFAVGTEELGVHLKMVAAVVECVRESQLRPGIHAVYVGRLLHQVPPGEAETMTRTLTALLGVALHHPPITLNGQTVRRKQLTGESWARMLTNAPTLARPLLQKVDTSTSAREVYAEVEGSGLPVGELFEAVVLTLEVVLAEIGPGTGSRNQDLDVLGQLAAHAVQAAIHDIPDRTQPSIRDTPKEDDVHDD